MSWITYRMSPLYSGKFFLPDKEFRYLRTVIVTAAVHWGFNSKLCKSTYVMLTHPLNLPALGRRQLLYIVLRLSRNLCF